MGRTTLPRGPPPPPPPVPGLGPASAAPGSGSACSLSHFPGNRDILPTPAQPDFHYPLGEFEAVADQTPRSTPVCTYLMGVWFARESAGAGWAVVSVLPHAPRLQRKIAYPSPSAGEKWPAFVVGVTWIPGLILLSSSLAAPPW